MIKAAKEEAARTRAEEEEAARIKAEEEARKILGNQMVVTVGTGEKSVFVGFGRSW